MRIDMMKASLAGLIALLLLCGCTAVSDGASPPAAPIFTDDSGTPISLSDEPTRVAVLFSSLADMWVSAGGETAITVGETVERGIVPEGVLLVDAGAGKTINTELLLSYAPDFVIGSLDIEAQISCAALLREAGIPTALFRVESFDDYLRVLGYMTDITGDAEAYERLGLGQRAEIDALLAAERSADAPRVLFLRAGSSARSTKAKTAEQHFAAEMLAELGGVNIADEAPLLIDGLSIEAVMMADPDLILITTMGDADAARAHMDALLSEPTWQSLTAVREGRVYYLPKDLFQFKPNAAWAQAYEMLAELMYETNP